MKHANPLWSKVSKLSANYKVRGGGQKILMVGVVVLLISVLASGSVLGYSLVLKRGGDIDYKNQNYAGAMDKYQKAKSYWFLGVVSSKLRDSDLETKISKSDVMIRSGQNYKDGTKEFESGNFDSAKYYFLRVALNDPNHNESQNKISIIEKNNEVFSKENKNSIGARVTPTKTPTPQKNNPTPTSTLIPSTSLTPTLSYTDLHCPRVAKIEDSLGNNSQSKNLFTTFKKGEVNVLTVKITATDPQNLPLYYQYESASLIDGNSTIKDWSKDVSYSIDVTNAMPGINRILYFSIDNQDNFSCAGDYTDIHGSFNYTVTP